MKTIYLREFSPNKLQQDFDWIKCIADVLEIRWGNWYIAIKPQVLTVHVSVGWVDRDECYINGYVPDKLSTYVLDYVWPDITHVNINQDYADGFTVELWGTDDPSLDIMFHELEYDSINLLRRDDSQGGYEVSNPIHTFDS